LQIIQSIILGIIQGLTEFIPVSSSAHLLLLQRLFGWDTSSVTFDVALHMGTLVALLGFFWKDWISIFASFGRRIKLRQPYSTDDEVKGSGRLLIPIAVATIPAAIVGIKLDAQIEAMRDKVWMIPAIAAALAVVAIIMMLAEKICSQKRGVGEMNYADYIIIGIAQAMALFPGVSRSGITIIAGLSRGLNRAAAARFSFLLSTPVILGAGVKQAMDVFETGLEPNQGIILLVGFIAAAVSGYFAIRFLMNFLQSRRLNAFAIYRIVLAAGILSTLLIK
jgi:undecaprenyl-diphosphatase